MKKNFKKIVVAALVGAMAITQLGVMPCATVDAASSVAISKKNFPDSRFREIVSEYDSNKDKKLSTSELKNLTGISIYNKYNAKGKVTKKVKSIKGIEKLKYLTSVYMYGTSVTSADLRKNTLLDDVSIHDNKKLTSLMLPTKKMQYIYLSHNAALKSSNINSCKSITYLGCENCPKLSVNIAGFKKLTGLSIFNTANNSLDLTKASKLSYATVGGKKLTSVKTSAKNKNLTSFTVYKATKLKSLNLSKLSKLSYIGIDYSPIDPKKIKVKKLSNITSVGFSTENKKKADLSRFTGATSLSFSGKSITSIDTSKNKKLEYLNIYRTSIKSLNVKKNTKLYGLWLYNCSKLTKLPTYSSLSEMSINNCGMKDISVSNDKTLSSLYLYDNAKLTKVSVSNASKFSYINISDCKNLTSLSLKKVPSFSSIGTIDNLPKLSSITIDDAAYLEYLSLSSWNTPKLKNICVSNAPNLYSVSTTGMNQAVTLKLSNVGKNVDEGHVSISPKMADTITVDEDIYNIAWGEKVLENQSNTWKPSSLYDALYNMEAPTPEVTPTIEPTPTADSDSDDYDDWVDDWDDDYYDDDDYDSTYPTLVATGTNTGMVFYLNLDTTN